MKLDKLFQSLLLTGAVVVLISTPARSEVNQGESSTGAVGESTFKDTLGVRNSKSPVLTASHRKHRDFPSQVTSSLQRAKLEKSNRKILQLNEISQVSQSAELLVQSPASSEVIQVTGVQANPTDNGVEVILQTTQGEQLQITNNSAENNFIADIPNAQLRLPSGDGFTFRSQNPIEGITQITVTNLDTNTIRVTVAGETGLPTVELFDGDEGLIFGFTPAANAMQPETEQPRSEIPQEEPSAQGDDVIELIVTGQQEDGYRVPNASVGTRTDTQLRDIPQSIQVIPQQILKDQQITRLTEAVRNVPGVETDGSSRSSSDFLIIRGFETGFNNASFLRNGIQDPRLISGGFNPATIERIEILRGPASVLFGNLEPGGAINLVTKQPLNEPFYAIEASVGSFNFYRGAIDLSGPLNENGTVLYRFNAAAQTSDSFIDFLFDRRYVIAPTLEVNFSENTSLNIWGEYSKIENAFDLGVPAVGSVLPNPLGSIPRNRNLTDPNNFNVDETYRIGFDLQHKFNDDWQLRSAFLSSFYTQNRDFVFTIALLPDNRTLTRGFSRANPAYNDDLYNLDTHVIGNFSTGSIQHRLTAGINLNWRNSFVDNEGATAEPIDIFNPVYSSPISPFSRNFRVEYDSRIVGVYIQDQMTLLDNLKFLLGGRFDFAHQNQRDILSNTETENNYQEFSPRLGIVYQPIQPISLYASYSRSFSLPDAAFSDITLQPEFGTQYEVGVKAELNQRLSANLAFYNLTRSNLPTTDPENLLRTIQVGKQRSRGVEFDISGEVMPGWNIIAGYALTDAKIIEDNNFPVGNTLSNVSRNSWNLWTTYQLQSGNLQGLGFGLGLFYVDNRQGDLANSFELPSYFRTDAAIFYNRDNWRLSINIKNLFDVDYFEYAQNRNRVVVGDPFTVQGTISWQF
ncbi:MAG: TonB-dependent siderophore receptor [Nodularia sp. (in: Bacteria)]|nr:MAG: TonB-dependent siderophore receptor [Nodularia sp. (in: cyanobacteria)]